MLPVIWNTQAQNDVDDIFEYISLRNRAAAERLADEIEASTEILSQHPHLHRLSKRLPGCREITVHSNYIVIYRVEIDCVRVVRVVHGSRIYF